MAKNPIRPIRIEGNIAYVTLTKECEAIIDASDADDVGMFNWYVRIDEHRFYVGRGTRNDANQPRVFMLHWTFLPKKDGFCVDHINGNQLDNRRSNLRYVTARQNGYNSRARHSGLSGLKGIFRQSSKNGWRARIRVNGKNINLGVYSTPEDAHRAYCVASEKYHGEFGRTI